MTGEQLFEQRLHLQFASAPYNFHSPEALHCWLEEVRMNILDPDNTPSKTRILSGLLDRFEKAVFPTPRTARE